MSKQINCDICGAKCKEHGRYNNIYDELGIPFCTIRRYTESKFTYYRSLLGQKFILKRESGGEVLRTTNMASNLTRKDVPVDDRTPKPEEEFVTCRLKDGSLGCSHRKADKCVCDCHKPEKEEKIMEKEECYICNKPIDPEEKGYWEWAEEPAHMECVLKTATKICSKCNYLTIDDENSCRDCGGKLRTLTKKDKEKLRKSEEKGI